MWKILAFILKMGRWSVVVCLISWLVAGGNGQRNSSVLSDEVLHHLTAQLGALENAHERQWSKLQELSVFETRAEVKRHEMVGFLDRMEARQERRLDDIAGLIWKSLTLQEEMKEDVYKLEQGLAFLRMWLQEQLGHRLESPTDPPQVPSAHNSASLHALGLSLRQLGEFLRRELKTIQSNTSALFNLTRAVEKESRVAVTKQYLQSALKNLRPDPAPLHILPQPPVSNGPALPRDCWEEMQSRGSNQSGIYRIRPDSVPHSLFVFCDMETDGGGWTVFQRRHDGSIRFEKEWHDYKYGFGNINGEYWLGNQYLHAITSQDIYELRVELEDFNNEHAWASYAGFQVAGEDQHFMLKLLGPFTDGDAGDGLNYHVSMKFTTIDSDNDMWHGGNCAESYGRGGWWYNQCDASNLNGQYLAGETQVPQVGTYWHEWRGPNYSLRKTVMKIRPIRRTNSPDLSQV